MKPADVFVHERAICDTQRIGSRSRVWPFAHILAGASLGADCNICESVFVENDVVIGDRVTVKGGVQLWDGITIGNDVFIGPNATFTNDKTPRSKKYQQAVLRTTIGRGATIGANATILPGLHIGRFAMVGAGAVVSKSVPAHLLVTGNPARPVRYVSEAGEELAVNAAVPGTLDVSGCRVLGLKVHRDARGSLLAMEHEANLPFLPRRTFVITDMGRHQLRGDHAHRVCNQFLTALHGTVSVFIDDGLHREVVVLNDPSVGLYLPPMTWCSIIGLDHNNVVHVFASHSYDDADYIRNYETFIAEREQQSGP